MVHVAQDADDFSGKSFVQDLDSSFYVALVAIGDGSVFNFLRGTPANFFNVFHKMWHGTSVSKGSPPGSERLLIRNSG